MGIEKVGWEELVVESLQYERSHHNFLTRLLPSHSPSAQLLLVPLVLQLPSPHLKHTSVRTLRQPQSVSPVTLSYLTLCDLMDCSTPGFPVHHQLLELAQTCVHGVGDAVQPSHRLGPKSDDKCP